MPDRIPLTSSKKALAAFKRLGFREAHKKGSHVTPERANGDGTKDTTVLLMGRSELKRFTLEPALELAKVSPEEFSRALR